MMGKIIIIICFAFLHVFQLDSQIDGFKFKGLYIDSQWVSSFLKVEKMKNTDAYIAIGNYGLNKKFIAKFNSELNLVWVKKIDTSLINFTLIDFVTTKSNEILLVARYDNNRNNLVLKIDSSGQTILTKNYKPNRFKKYLKIQDNINNGFLISGSDSSFMFISKYDSLGNAVWEKTIYIDTFKQSGSLNNIIVDKEGNIFLIGKIEYNYYSKIHDYIFFSKLNQSGTILKSEKLKTYFYSVTNQVNFVLNNDNSLIGGFYSNGNYHLVRVNNDFSLNWIKKLSYYQYNNTTLYLSPLRVTMMNTDNLFQFDTNGNFISAKQFNNNKYLASNCNSVFKKSDTSCVVFLNNTTDYSSNLSSVAILDTNLNMSCRTKTIQNLFVDDTLKMDNVSVVLYDTHDSITSLSITTSNVNYKLIDQIDTPAISKLPAPLCIGQKANYQVLNMDTVLWPSNFTIKDKNTAFFKTSQDTIVNVEVRKGDCIFHLKAEAKVINVVIDNTIYINDGVLTTAQANATYQWFNCNYNWIINKETNQNFAPQADGNYSVITSYLSCVDTSDCIPFTFIYKAGIQSIIDLNLNIYPNPCTDFIQIELEKVSKSSKLKIYNILGKEIYMSNVSSLKTIVDCANFEKGVYTITIEDDENKYVRKIVKQ